MPKAIKIAGKKFNRLTAICRIGTDKFGKAIWSFECECGKACSAVGSSVVQGATKSCGCLGVETSRANGKMSHGPVTHNNSNPGSEFYLEYRTWVSMRQRCSNASCSDYPDYGGRGISVCSEWNEFTTFVKDMGKRPVKSSIDRINNNLGYSKTNCRWATNNEQAKNRRKRSCYRKIKP